MPTILTTQGDMDTSQLEHREVLTERSTGVSVAQEYRLKGADPNRPWVMEDLVHRSAAMRQFTVEEKLAYTLRQQGA